MVEVLEIETPSLGDRSYLAHDGNVAVVIDPQRDTDRITALAERQGVRITHVAENHIHNDYVSGGLALPHRLPRHGRRLHPRGRRPPRDQHRRRIRQRRRRRAPYHPDHRPHPGGRTSCACRTVGS
jgi:glyoxylase-like metal-dependent hydrolase (beta-lactamase superfamily II)